jgi:hypothetical protein
MKIRSALSLCLAFLMFAVALGLAQGSGSRKPALKAFSIVRPARDANGNMLSPAEASANSSLPTFNYTTVSTRDGNTYSGVMVGQDPFSGGPFTTTAVDTPIVPLIITTKSVAFKLSKGGILSTIKGFTTFNPTVADHACLKSPNDIPLALFLQSPILRATSFSFGPTSVGTTQYVDAFQRGNFSLQDTGYHTLLHPHVLPPVHLVFSANQALAIPSGLFGSCGPLGIVNINTIYPVLLNLVAAEGFNSSQFPVFLMYNTVMSIGVPRNLNRCCILGFHDAVGSPIQTFSPIDFDTTHLFGPGIVDTSVAAHEIGEWMDDPFGSNPTLWGHMGQVGGCQGNLEVGDPLTGTNVPTVTSPVNGFKYHLQELAFFSWFYGAPSIGVNGWFSDNNTFKSDAGPACTKK